MSKLGRANVLVKILSNNVEIIQCCCTHYLLSNIVTMVEELKVELHFFVWDSTDNYNVRGTNLLIIGCQRILCQNCAM